MKSVSRTRSSLLLGFVVTPKSYRFSFASRCRPSNDLHLSIFVERLPPFEVLSALLSGFYLFSFVICQEVVCLSIRLIISIPFLCFQLVSWYELARNQLKCQLPQCPSNDVPMMTPEYARSSPFPQLSLHRRPSQRGQGGMILGRCWGCFNELHLGNRPSRFECSALRRVSCVGSRTASCPPLKLQQKRSEGLCKPT